MSQNPKYSRFFELLIILVSVDILHVVVSIALWLLLGSSGPEATAFPTASTILSNMLLWVKLGLVILFLKQVPMRLAPPAILKTARRLWVLAFFWPLVLSTLRR